MFIFGDSMSYNGNNNLLPTLAYKINFPPKHLHLSPHRLSRATNTPTTQIGDKTMTLWVFCSFINVAAGSWPLLPHPTTALSPDLRPPPEPPPLPLPFNFTETRPTADQTQNLSDSNIIDKNAVTNEELAQGSIAVNRGRRSTKMPARFNS